MKEHDFLLERRLRDLDPKLHRCFTNAVFALQTILSNYKLIFPDFTDHTELHSLNVIEFCNHLIGKQIDKLNADEIFSILLGCYFHDTGMGITPKDYEEFSKNIDFGDFFATHSRDDIQTIVRCFHNEYSGQFIKKYARFFEFPSPAHEFAIIQISRGHRKTNLWDKEQFPIALQTPNGGSICLLYLSALVRLADEIDVTASRNSHAIYDLSKITGEIDLIEFMKHDAIRDLEITEKEFIMKVHPQDDFFMQALRKVAGKMQKTLDECRSVVSESTSFVITQEKVRIEEV